MTSSARSAAVYVFATKYMHRDTLIRSYMLLIVTIFIRIVAISIWRASAPSLDRYRCKVICFFGIDYARFFLVLEVEQALSLLLFVLRDPFWTATAQSFNSTIVVAQFPIINCVQYDQCGWHPEDSPLLSRAQWVQIARGTPFSHLFVLHYSEWVACWIMAKCLWLHICRGCPSGRSSHLRNVRDWCIYADGCRNWDGKIARPRSPLMIVLPWSSDFWPRKPTLFVYI